MSNPFGWLTPPGCGANDTGPMGEDDYKCEVCGRTCTQGELDPGADDPVCRECVEMRKEEAEKVEHTPGPWRVEATEQGISVGTEDVNICVMSCADGSLESERADAHLIAAAPALLAACKAALAQDPSYWREIVANALTLARGGAK